MKTSARFLVLLAIPIIFAGCNSIEQEIQDATGLKIVYADSNAQNDSCVAQQLSAFEDEYSQLSKQDQAALKSKIRSAGYTELVLNESKLTQTIGGSFEQLYYAVNVNGYSSYQGSKIIADNRTYSGTAPGATEIAKSGKQITLTPEYSQDQSDRKDYTTYDVNVYSSVTSDSALVTALKSGAVVFSNDNGQTGDNCGSAVSINSLISK